MNIKIWVCDPQNLDHVEAQTYTNYQGLSISEIKRAFGRACVLAPEVGAFPHMGGHNKPVKILKIFPTKAEDNAGLDIAKVIQNYKDWGSK